MFAALLTLCSAAVPLRVAVLPLPGDRGPDLAERLSQKLATGGGGIDVISPGAAAAQLDDDRMNQLLGCNGGRACLLSGASSLGADYLVASRPTEAGWVVELRDGKSGEVLAVWPAGRRSQAADPEPAGDRPGIDEAFAERIGAEVRQALAPEPQAPQSRSVFRYLPIGVGGVVLLGGIALFGYAVTLQQRLVKGDPDIDSVDRAESFAARGRSVEVTGYLFAGVGLALVLGGVAFAYLAPESDVTVGLGWSGGPVAGLSGRFW